MSGLATGLGPMEAGMLALGAVAAVAVLLAPLAPWLPILGRCLPAYAATLRDYIATLARVAFESLAVGWNRWRLRKAPVPLDGKPLDLIDQGRWAMVLRGYGDKAGTEAVAEDEQIAEALMSDVEDS